MSQPHPQDGRYEAYEEYKKTEINWRGVMMFAIPAAVGTVILSVAGARQMGIAALGAVALGIGMAEWSWNHGGKEAAVREWADATERDSNHQCKEINKLTTQLKKEKLEELMDGELRDEFEELFPKGASAERGAGIVWYAGVKRFLAQTIDQVAEVVAREAFEAGAEIWEQFKHDISRQPEE
jgi:hypothetical protein